VRIWFRTYFGSRVFYEASRDLDSQPPPRANHVEACRPLGVNLCSPLILDAQVQGYGLRIEVDDRRRHPQAAREHDVIAARRNDRTSKR
jgi:hypothetical protein